MSVTAELLLESALDGQVRGVLLVQNGSKEQEDEITNCYEGADGISAVGYDGEIGTGAAIGLSNDFSIRRRLELRSARRICLQGGSDFQDMR